MARFPSVCCPLYRRQIHKNFNCSEQYRCMAFARLTCRSSLRDIEICLRPQASKLYHMGIRKGISRNNLANANQFRDWRIYAVFAQNLIRIARSLQVDDALSGIDIDDSIYALDSTTIDLCLSLFPWAQFRKKKGAVKMHTLLDLHGNIPTFIHISDGKLHDVNILDLLPLEARAFYIMGNYSPHIQPSIIPRNFKGHLSEILFHSILITMVLDGRIAH